MPPTLRKTSTLPLASLTPPTIKTTTITIHILNNPMARDASSNASGIIKPPVRRGRPTNAMRASLLAGHGARNCISSGNGNPKPPTRLESEIAYAEKAKAKEEKEMVKKREKANVEKRNRVDDQDNEVARFEFDFSDNNKSHTDMDLDMSMDNNEKNISFGSTDADGSVSHHHEEDEEEEEDLMSRARLIKEGKELRRRIQVLESEMASLTSTRLIEHTRLKSINAALIDRLQETRAAEACATATAQVWEGQMMDRDGEVQRLRGLLEMEKIKEEDRRGIWEMGGDEAVS